MSTAAKALNISVLLGSTRDGRFVRGTAAGSRRLKVAQAVVAKATALGHKVTLLDAKELKFPLLEKPLHHYNAESPAPAWLTDVAAKLNEADAFILVDGEYNHGPTPGMINLLDHFYHPQYKFKAAGLATYGAMCGGARAGYVLRNSCAELGMVVAPTNFVLPSVFSAFDGEGKLTNQMALDGIDKFLSEFTFLARSLADVRKNITFMKV